MSPQQRAVRDGIVNGPRGKISPPFEVMLHSAGFAGALEDVGVYLRYNSPLPAMLREFAILIICRHWKAGYEWSSHQPLALAEGLSQIALDAVVWQDRNRLVGQSPLLGHVYDFVAALLDGGNVVDKLYDALLKELGETALTDLVGLTGYYGLLAMAINAHEVPASPATKLPWEGNIR